VSTSYRFNIMNQGNGLCVVNVPPGVILKTLPQPRLEAWSAPPQSVVP
jgi:hypothetical protein